MRNVRLAAALLLCACARTSTPDVTETRICIERSAVMASNPVMSCSRVLVLIQPAPRLQRNANR